MASPSAMETSPVRWTAQSGRSLCTPANAGHPVASMTAPSVHGINASVANARTPVKNPRNR
jgi:hypothetical protein